MAATEPPTRRPGRTARPGETEGEPRLKLTRPTGTRTPRSRRRPRHAPPTGRGPGAPRPAAKGGTAGIRHGGTTGIGGRSPPTRSASRSWPGRPRRRSGWRTSRGSGGGGPPKPPRPVKLSRGRRRPPLPPRASAPSGPSAVPPGSATTRPRGAPPSPPRPPPAAAIPPEDPRRTPGNSTGASPGANYP